MHTWMNNERSCSCCSLLRRFQQPGGEKDTRYLQSEDAKLQLLRLWVGVGLGLRRRLCRLAQVRWAGKSENSFQEIREKLIINTNVCDINKGSVKCEDDGLSSVPFCCLVVSATWFMTTPSMPFWMRGGDAETRPNSSQLSVIFCSTFSSSAARPARSISFTHTRHRHVHALRWKNAHNCNDRTSLHPSDQDRSWSRPELRASILWVMDWCKNKTANLFQTSSPCVVSGVGHAWTKARRDFLWKLNWQTSTPVT